ncbi:MAG: hypothetical protein WCK42_07050, partial [Myxococcaceae bacterium]
SYIGIDSTRSSGSDVSASTSHEPDISQAETKILSQPKREWWQFWKSAKKPEALFKPQATRVEGIHKKIDEINKVQNNPDRLQAISDYITYLNTAHEKTLTEPKYKKHGAAILEEMTRAYDEFKALRDAVSPAPSENLTSESVLNRLSLLNQEESLIFLNRLKRRLTSKEAESVSLLIEKINDPKRNTLKTLADFISTYITEQNFAATLKDTVDLFKNPKFQEFANNILTITPEKEDAAHLASFHSIPNVQETIGTGIIIHKNIVFKISEQLKNGELNQNQPNVVLSTNEQAIASILPIKATLEKLEDDRIQLTAALASLKENQKQLERARKYTEILLSQNELREKRVNLSRHLENIRKREDETTGISKEIDTTERALNLVQRMKRTTVLKATIQKKSDIQRQINQQNKYLTAITTVVDNPLRRAPSDQEIVDFGRKTEEVIQYSDLAGIKNSIEKSLSSLKNNASQLDTLFEQELLRLQDQDADPELGKIPIDYWIPWLGDIAREATGLCESSRRLGQERANVLVREKLLADQGISMTEAYERLMKTLVTAFNINNPKKQLEEFSRLIRLPEWIWKNPNLARELLGNVRLTLLELYASKDQSVFGPAIDYLKSDAWMTQIIGWSESAKDDSISPDCLAILDISSYAPILIAASRCEQSTLGNWLNLLPGGQRIGDAISGTIRGITTKAIAQKTADAFPGIGQFIEAFNSLKAGEDPLDVSKTLIKRGALAEITKFARDIYYLGPKKAFQEVGSNFNSWRKHASGFEKGWRMVSEAGPIAVGAWLCTTGVGIVFGVPCIAFGVSMRWVNEHLFFRKTTEKVNADMLKRRRDERRMKNDDYSAFLQGAKPLPNPL